MVYNAHGQILHCISNTSSEMYSRLLICKALLCFMIASPAESNSKTQSVQNLDSYTALKGFSVHATEIKGFIQVTLSKTAAFC